MRKCHPIAVACVALAGAFAHAETLEVSGSTTVNQRVIEPHGAAIKAATGIDLKMYAIGSGKGMMELADRKVPMAAVSESLEEAVASAEKGAKAEGKTYKRPDGLKFHNLVTDSMVVVVHRDNPVTKLTPEQARDLNSGKIRNWKEVGGPDLPVKVVTGAPNSATRAVFQSKVMGGEAYAADAAQMRTTAEEVKNIGVSKGAIGVVSEAFAKAGRDKVKPVSGVAVQRPLAFVTVGDPNPAAQKVIAFLRSKEGQKLLEQ
jgi:phosphate transport system substrate-binding protein